MWISDGFATDPLQTNESGANLGVDSAWDTVLFIHTPLGCPQFIHVVCTRLATPLSTPLNARTYSSIFRRS